MIDVLLHHRLLTSSPSTVIHILVLLLLLLFVLAAGIAFHCCGGDYRHNIRDCNIIVIMPITPFAVAITVQSPSPMTVIIHTIPPRSNDPTLFRACPQASMFSTLAKAVL